LDAYFPKLQDPSEYQACTCGGTAASAVELDDIPDFDQICENCKAQRKIEQKKKDAKLGGKHLAVSELKKEKAKKKARKLALKAKADRNKAAAVIKMTGAVERSNFLSAIALYDKMGMDDKVREPQELYKTSLTANDDIQEPTDEEKSDKDESSADHDDSSSKLNDKENEELDDDCLSGGDNCNRAVMEGPTAAEGTDKEDDDSSMEDEVLDLVPV
jgi:hypothetical protein